MKPVELQPRVNVNGREWALYGVEYKTADGTFITYVYAISDEHAAMVVEELRESATVLGRSEGVS